MRTLPAEFCSRIEHEWPDRSSGILDALRTGEPRVSVRLNPSKWPGGLRFPDEWLIEPIPWSKHGYYVRQRPLFTLDPLMHAGAYYVQDASSQILDEILRQLGSFNLGLDLCAAPGGKSQILSGYIAENGHLMCNEISRIRLSALEETLVKWGNPRLSIWNWDAKGFGQSDFRFDLILLDAPCSGEGLFRKEAAAIARWSPWQVEACSNLQRSIIDDILPCLAPGGVIIYSTCTLATQENEHIWKYLLNQGLEPIFLNIPSEWGWTDSSELHHDLPKDAAFRMMPGQGGGEAFFICCFRKKSIDMRAEAGHSDKYAHRFTEYPVRGAIDPGSLILPGDVQIIQLKNEHWLVGKGMMNEYNPRSWKKCSKPGIRMGGLNGTGSKIPVHESALLSDCNWETHPAIDLSEREALWYLSGREFDPGHMPDGCFLVRFKGLALGWSKRKGRSMARSYPAAWRIKMRA